MHSNVVKERRSQKFPWSSRYIEYFSTGLSLAFVQVFSVLFSHFILQPRTIRRARRLCGRKEPLGKIENIGKKTGRERRKGRRMWSLKATVSAAMMAQRWRARTSGSSVRRKVSESRKQKSNSFWKYFRIYTSIANLDTNRMQEKCIPLSSLVRLG